MELAKSADDKVRGSIALFSDGSWGIIQNKMETTTIMVYAGIIWDLSRDLAVPAANPSCKCNAGC